MCFPGPSGEASYRLAAKAGKDEHKAFFGAMMPVSAPAGATMSIKDRRLFVTAIGVIAAIVAGSYLMQLPGWMKRRREERQWTAINDLTPDHLVARCGQPLADETKDLYPIVVREMSYLASGGQTVVFKFSRTAEQGSAWVLMSMRNAVSGSEYQTPAVRITALRCLDSKK